MNTIRHCGANDLQALFVHTKINKLGTNSQALILSQSSQRNYIDPTDSFKAI